MAVDLRRQALHRSVGELIAFESELQARLEREQQAARGYSDAMASIEHFAPMVRTQRDQLVAYVERLGSDPDGDTTSSSFVFNSAATVSSALRQISVAFNHAR